MVSRASISARALERSASCRLTQAGRLRVLRIHFGRLIQVHVKKLGLLKPSPDKTVMIGQAIWLLPNMRLPLLLDGFSGKTKRSNEMGPLRLEAQALPKGVSKSRACFLVPFWLNIFGQPQPAVCCFSTEGVRRQVLRKKTGVQPSPCAEIGEWKYCFLQANEVHISAAVQIRLT